MDKRVKIPLLRINNIKFECCMLPFSSKFLYPQVSGMTTCGLKSRKGITSGQHPDQLQGPPSHLRMGISLLFYWINSLRAGS